MRETKPPFVWPSEAVLCAEFAKLIPTGWTLYNETAGFDMVVVHDDTGAQIGIEAKLVLNAKVLAQAVDGLKRNACGPDFRAVLVGKVGGDLTSIASLLGITVMTLRGPLAKWRHWEWQGPEQPTFGLSHSLPSVKGDCWWDDGQWHDLAPLDRLKLPAYVPDVEAGHPAPLVLSEWKIKAIKVCVYVEKHGSIDRAIFKALGIDPSRWMTGAWLKKAVERGKWVAGDYFPATSYRRLHPTIYRQIEEEYPTWAKEAKVAA